MNTYKITTVSPTPYLFYVAAENQFEATKHWTFEMRGSDDNSGLDWVINSIKSVELIFIGLELKGEPLKKALEIMKQRKPAIVYCNIDSDVAY